MTENHTPTEVTDLTVTVRADDLAAVLNAVDYMSDRTLIGPVDRMGDALANRPVPRRRAACSGGPRMEAAGWPTSTPTISHEKRSQLRLAIEASEVLDREVYRAEQESA